MAVAFAAGGLGVGVLIIDGVTDGSGGLVAVGTEAPEDGAGEAAVAGRVSVGLAATAVGVFASFAVGDTMAALGLGVEA